MTTLLLFLGFCTTVGLAATFPVWGPFLVSADDDEERDHR